MIGNLRGGNFQSLEERFIFLSAERNITMNQEIGRRKFIKQTSAAGIGIGLAAQFRSLAQTPPRANNKITVAVIGTNSRGLAHVDAFASAPDTEVAYICDVDDRVIAKGIAAASKKQKTAPKGLKDFRKALEDKSLDAVSIATPDHWHAPMAIMAMAAGKHVYLEKPCSHNPHEGELLIEAVKKYQRVFQMGNQRRSFPNVRLAMDEIHNGVIGKAYFARCWYANSRESVGRGEPAPVPEWLDWELWQGPAPRRPFRSKLVHYNWHWFWHWGTGESLNNGTHFIDLCRWALAVDWPSRVVSVGGRYHFQDDWETPDTQLIGWDFDGGKSISWESRSCNGYPEEKLSTGARIHGTDGTVLLGNNAYTVFDKKSKIVKEVKGTQESNTANLVSGTGANLDQAHFRNFLDAIRSGQQPNSPIEEAHKSVGLLQLGNIAWRVSRELHCDAANGHIQNDADAMKLWSREYEPGWQPAV